MIKIERDGLYEGNRHLTNFRIDVAMVFTDPTSGSDLPAMVEAVIALEDGTNRSMTLKIGKSIGKEIVENWDYCVVYGQTAERKIHQYIVEQIIAMRRQQALDDVINLNLPEKEGYIIPRNGGYQLPNDEQVIVWNGKIAGNRTPKIPIKVIQREDIFIENDVIDAEEIIVDAIYKNQPEVLLALTFALLTSVRSCLADKGYYFQGALYIMGPQSVGKTTLARRVLGFALDPTTYHPALFLEAASTEAAVRDVLAENPNLPVILDDLSLSSERSVEKQRKKLGAAILRLAANDAIVAKKGAGGLSTMRCECNAGLALTAEFPLEGLSELTRCVIVNITHQLQLTDNLTPALSGCIVSNFVDWFADNYETEINLLEELMQAPEKVVGYFSMDEKHKCSILLRQQRLQRNFMLLYWTFSCFMEMIESKLALSEEQAKQLWEIFSEAMNNSVMAQLEILRQIDSRNPDGSISYIILQGIHKRAFNLCRKKEKLFTHDGIIWEEDDDENPLLIGIKEEALVRFVRNQNGYQEISSTRIKRQLKDLGALALRESKGDTVHLGKSPESGRNLPRVLLLRMDVLVGTAKCFKPDEEGSQDEQRFS